MGVLQDFERRLEGAVEGFFARTFSSGLQPVELAKGLQRYARDTRFVANDGVVVPNVYRFEIHPDDDKRLRRAGVDLETELAKVVVDTAVEQGWILRGSALVLLEHSEDVRVGRYELAGRIEATRERRAHAGPHRPSRVRTEEPPPDPSTEGEQRGESGAAEVSDAEGAEAGAAAAARAPDARAPAGVDAPDPDGGEERFRTRIFTSPPAPDGHATLRVVAGGAVRNVRLTGRTVAGRAPGSAIHLKDSSVSREHAAFVRRGGTWWVVDLGSTNGTEVNDRKAGEHALRDGDRVRLGEAVLEFVEG